MVSGASVGDLSLQDELVILCRSLDADPGSEDLDQAPALAGVLVNLLLIVIAGLASGGDPTFAEADELVLVSGVVLGFHGVTLHPI